MMTYKKSSHQRCSVKHVFLKITQNLQENPWQSLFFDKVAGLSPLVQVFSCEFAKFLRTSVFIKHLLWLLLALTISFNQCIHLFDVIMGS